MNPDEAKLALWLDDELTGEDLAAMEAWAVDQPDRLAAREEVRRWRGLINESLPASEEPPYPDFFNKRVLQAIHESAPRQEIPVVAKRVSWASWFTPLAACAGMALAFWVGTQTRKPPEYNVAGAPKAIIIEPAVYTPERGVNAEWFASHEAAATVIVLNGVAAIPDTMDFSATAAVPSSSERDSTAGMDFELELRSGS
jgi:hypothetical protein